MTDQPKATEVLDPALEKIKWGMEETLRARDAEIRELKAALEELKYDFDQVVSSSNQFKAERDLANQAGALMTGGADYFAVGVWSIAKRGGSRLAPWHVYLHGWRVDVPGTSCGYQFTSAFQSAKWIVQNRTAKESDYNRAREAGAW